MPGCIGCITNYISSLILSPHRDYFDERRLWGGAHLGSEHRRWGIRRQVCGQCYKNAYAISLLLASLTHHSTIRQVRTRGAHRRRHWLLSGRAARIEPRVGGHATRGRPLSTTSPNPLPHGDHQKLTRVSASGREQRGDRGVVPRSFRGGDFLP